MTLFFVLAALLTVGVVGRLLWPLWRAGPRRAVTVAQLNSTVYRDQLQELERDLARGLLSEPAYHEAREELQRRLLEDVEGAGPPDGAGAVAGGSAGGPPRTAFPPGTPVGDRRRRPGRWTAAALVLALPLAAAGLYARVGSVSAIGGDANAAAPADVVQAVERLADALRKNPDNPQGWLLLARTYRKMERFAESAAAYDRAGALVQQDPDLLVEQADVLTAAAGDQIEGRPMALVHQALRLDARHPMALMLMGVSAYRRGDPASAIAHWETLLTVLEPGSAEAEQVQANIDQARREGGPAVAATGARTQGTGATALPSPDLPVGANGPAGSAPVWTSAASAAPATGAGNPAGADLKETPGRPIGLDAARITGEVVLSPQLAAQVRPDDVLFVIARPNDGSRAPVAVLRRRGSELPLQFALDDSLAMMPDRTLSKATDVTVVARISRSGQPMAQPGDLTSEPSAPVRPGAIGLRLVIDRAL